MNTSFNYKYYGLFTTHFYADSNLSQFNLMWFTYLIRNKFRRLN